MADDRDSYASTRREKIIEHVFVGDLLRHLWKSGVHEVDVLRAESDTSGYDLVIELGPVTRHVQLKASAVDSKTSRQSIQLALGRKPSGCVLWIRFDRESLELGPFLWFGGEPGAPLPSLSGFKTAKHTRADATGLKRERINLRVVPKKCFKEVASVAEVAVLLFGKSTHGDAR